MVRLRFLFSLCLSISLVFEQLAYVSGAYASSAFSDEGYGPRHRKGGPHTPVSQSTEPDVEKAESSDLSNRQMREQNKAYLDKATFYGMISFVSFACYMMLWNFGHTPQTMSRSRPYDSEDFRQAHVRNNSFTNSNAYATLQILSLMVAGIATLASFYNLWKIGDKKELRAKGKAKAFDTSMTLLGGAAESLRIIPNIRTALQEGWKPGQETETFRPSQGSTVIQDLSSTRETWEKTITLFGLRDYPMMKSFLRLRPVSPEFQQGFSELLSKSGNKKMIFDGSNLSLSSWDLTSFLSSMPFYKIDLTNGDLSDHHVELLPSYSSRLHGLDVRGNPKISEESLFDLILSAIAPQGVRRIMGFPQLREIEVDARLDVICKRQLLRGVTLPEKRKVSVTGKFSNARLDELGNLFDREFYYVSGSTSNSTDTLDKLIGKVQLSLKRGLEETYHVKSYGDDREAEYKKVQQEFSTIRNVLEYIYGLGTPLPYLIECEGPQSFSLFVSNDQFPIQTSSYKGKSYRFMHEGRLYGKVSAKFGGRQKLAEYLEKFYQSDGDQKSSLVEFNAEGKPIVFGSNIRFVYHDQRDVVFTSSKIFVPEELRSQENWILYLRDIQKSLRNDPTLLAKGPINVNSSAKPDFQTGVTVRLEHCHLQHLSTEQLDAEGLLKGVRWIEALTRAEFLKNLQFSVLE